VPHRRLLTLIALAIITTAMVNVEAKKKREPAPTWKVEFSEYLRGMTSYKSGDFAAAMEIWLSLAERGYAPAKFAVGDMYYRGEGVDRDVDVAAKWIGEAADSWIPGAQYHQAFLYIRGEGVPQDPVQAYRYLRLAEKLGHKDAKALRDRLERTLDSEQIAEALREEEEAGLELPVLIHRVTAEYPPLAKDAGLEDLVTLELRIAEDGSVHEPRLLHVDHPTMGFAEAAIDAATQWRYEPARLNGEPVEIYFWMSVAFEMK
jgi:TonB family protein